MDWTTILSTAAGVILGGLINALFSWLSSRQLRREAERLRRLNIMQLRLLDQAGLIPVKWDDHGNPLMEVGRSVELRWNVEEQEDQEQDQETP